MMMMMMKTVMIVWLLVAVVCIGSITHMVTAKSNKEADGRFSINKSSLENKTLLM